MRLVKGATATRDIAASPDQVFALVADPARQPEFDGNENLASSSSPRVRAVGEVFETLLTFGSVRQNHVVEFEEGRLIAWRPSDVGTEPPGHLWRWEVEPAGTGSRVTHTYDWSELTDEKRMERARNTTPERLRASLDRLAAILE